jgi:hypothetical protein
VPRDWEAEAREREFDRWLAEADVPEHDTYVDA